MKIILPALVVFSSIPPIVQAADLGIAPQCAKVVAAQIRLATENSAEFKQSERVEVKSVKLTSSVTTSFQGVPSLSVNVKSFVGAIGEDPRETDYDSYERFRFEVTVHQGCAVRAIRRVIR